MKIIKCPVCGWHHEGSCKEFNEVVRGDKSWSARHTKVIEDSTEKTYLEGKAKEEVLMTKEQREIYKTFCKLAEDLAMWDKLGNQAYYNAKKALNQKE